MTHVACKVTNTDRATTLLHMQRYRITSMLPSVYYGLRAISTMLSMKPDTIHHCHYGMEHHLLSLCIHLCKLCDEPPPIKDHLFFRSLMKPTRSDQTRVCRGGPIIQLTALSCRPYTILHQLVSTPSFPICRICFERI